jgi:hypothetical protein
VTPVPELSFPLRITIPEHVHAGVLAEIDDDAQQHDRTQADAIARWVGGLLDEAAQLVADKLPDGFGCKVGGAFFASPSLEVSREVYRYRRDATAAQLDEHGIAHEVDQ